MIRNSRSLSIVSNRSHIERLDDQLSTTFVLDSRDPHSIVGTKFSNAEKKHKDHRYP